MSDTVDLLAAIGSNASLRHATPDDLLPVLESAGADEALTAAVADDDAGSLAGKLGYARMQSTQVIVVPAHEEEDEDEEGKEDDESHERHDEARLRA